MEEERQRAEREREKKGDEVDPQWFHATGDTTQTPWGELELYGVQRQVPGTQARPRRGKETPIMQADPDAPLPPLRLRPLAIQGAD